MHMHFINLSEGETQIYHGLLLGIIHILATMYGTPSTTTSLGDAEVWSIVGFVAKRPTRVYHSPFLSQIISASILFAHLYFEDTQNLVFFPEKNVLDPPTSKRVNFKLLQLPCC